MFAKSAIFVNYWNYSKRFDNLHFEMQLQYLYYDLHKKMD